MSQVATSGERRKEQLRDIAAQAKQYARDISENPGASPMFPVINEYNGAAETICFMHGYVAGLAVSAGGRPTRAEMDELRDTVMHDPAVRDMAVKIQKSVEIVPGLVPPREF